MYRCTAAFGFNDVSRAGLDAAVTAVPPISRGIDIARCPGPTSSLTPLRALEGGSPSGSKRIPLVPGIVTCDHSAISCSLLSLSRALSLRSLRSALPAACCGSPGFQELGI